jgi:hypothetical protein
MLINASVDLFQTARNIFPDKNKNLRVKFVT